MSMTIKQIEFLLDEDEGTSLDFKRDQYKFEGASKEDKSELLKDILAFANAFRRSDAYILVGVEEVRAGRSKVVGIGAHLDDAKLQQFVNSKTKNPVTFSYREATHDGRTIGIIHIPVQTRPIYSKVDYGRVRKETVYLRRGSSTDTAKPEEIARMGTVAADWAGQPSVELSLVERSTGANLDNRVSINRCTWYDIPIDMEIPDYEPGNEFRLGRVEFASSDHHVNADFLRDVAAYLRAESCFPVSLEIRNTAGTVIHDMMLAIELKDPEGQYEILTPDQRPPKPSPSKTSIPHEFGSIFDRPDVFVTKEGETWKVKCIFGKIQPGATVRLQDDFLIGCRDARETEICGLVYADNISSPIPIRIHLSFQVESQSLSIGEIEHRASSFARRFFWF